VIGTVNYRYLQSIITWLTASIKEAFHFDQASSKMADHRFRTDRVGTRFIHVHITMRILAR